MVRSMYSGVSGLRSHQTRMDTIGNNIANVNTYGFKSGRTTFRDIYYQTLSSASQPTAAAGGTNPSAVGYGSKVGSVDLMMGRSTFSMTDQTMDLAIDGEGFFQVQDGAGNIYYTRAGMLNFDAAGNLVDMQGNYVLGINGDPTGRAPGTERIAVALPPVPPTAASVVQTLNGKEFTVSATNPTSDGNLNLNFTTDNSVADGQIVAQISTSGIIFKMSPTNTYASAAEFSAALNNAVTTANGNEPHVMGDLMVQFTGTGSDPFDEAYLSGSPLTAEEICSVSYGIKKGTAAFGSSESIGGMYPTGVGNTFSGSGDIGPVNVTYQAAVGGNPAKWVVEMEVGGVTYKGEVDSTRTTASEFYLYNTEPGADKNDYVVMKRPSFDNITDYWAREQPSVPATPGQEAKYTVTVPAGPTPLTGNSSGIVTIAGVEVDVTDLALDTDSSGTVDYSEQITALLAAINAEGTYTATLVGGNIALTANAVGVKTTPTYDFVGGTFNTATVDQAGIDPTPERPANASDLVDGAAFNPIDPTTTAKASAPSRALGFSGSAFAMRNGTVGGPQTIADMTGISIAPNGVITGWDSQGVEMIIGRIDIATFANPSGLNQSGSSNYTESSNSGQPILSQPGSGGAGKLVGGTLELSNVDLSREFSDMITTQRGYQANSRIITVSDTMLEELINLKR